MFKELKGLGVVVKQLSKALHQVVSVRTPAGSCLLHSVILPLSVAYSVSPPCTLLIAFLMRSHLSL